MKKQVQKIKENKGFSMIELIIVVAIMAILVGIIGAALIPYMEKSRASKDKATLDGLYQAYATIIAETEDTTTLTDATIKANTELWELAGASNEAALKAKFKSKQFKGTTITFITPDANGNYGVWIKGMNGYTAVQIDNTGRECKAGVKGTATSLPDGTAAGTLTSTSGGSGN